MSMLSMSEKALVENMSCGAFNNMSYWGYKGSVLKSGVCKYYRREMFDKFEWCVMEMMIFGLKNKGMMTNIINRMKILIMEELVVNEMDIIDMCVYVFEKIEKEEEYLKKVGWMKVVCDMVKGCKKCRMVSYVNNWWKYNGVEYGYIELNKVLKYKKKGDSEELLKLGEWLIVYVEEKSERVIDIYNKMLKLENEGMRYRRKDGVYLYFEILKELVNDRVFEFVLGQFMRRDMKERFMFGVWLGLICVYNENKVDNVCMEDVMKDVCMNDEEVVEYLFKRRNKIVIDEDFVVCDFHVSKKYGLGRFGRVGSYVENEDYSLLGENGMKYKEFYILKKDEMDKENINMKEEDRKEVVEEKKENVVVEKKKVEKKKEGEGLEKIEFDSFELVRVIVEGVCGLKKCCIIMRKDGVLYVLKEMGKAFNGGRDYKFMDDIKKEFGLLDLKMRLIRSDKGLKLKDKSVRCWKDNWELEEKEVVYCMMKFYENWGDLSKYKNILRDENKVREMMKIRLFDGLFRSSDNILRNILVLKSGELLSIDENDIFGKREYVFGKSDWCLNNEICKNMYSEIMDELLEGDGKKERIIGKLREYGFEEKVEEFVNRWDNYKEIVGKEFM